MPLLSPPVQVSCDAVCTPRLSIWSRHITLNATLLNGNWKMLNMLIWENNDFKAKAASTD
jgi:hypothetical protein